MLAKVFAPMHVTRYCCPETTPVIWSMLVSPNPSEMSPVKPSVVEVAVFTNVPLLDSRATPWSVFDACSEPLLDGVKTAEP